MMTSSGTDETALAVLRNVDDVPSPNVARLTADRELPERPYSVSGITVLVTGPSGELLLVEDDLPSTERQQSESPTRTLHRLLGELGLDPDTLDAVLVGNLTARSLTGPKSRPVTTLYYHATVEHCDESAGWVGPNELRGSEIGSRWLPLYEHLRA